MIKILENHGFEHTLMDYNNASSTKYGDILRILEIAKERIKKEIENNKKRRGWDSNPRFRHNRNNRLAGDPDRPLQHLSTVPLMAMLFYHFLDCNQN